MITVQAALIRAESCNYWRDFDQSILLSIESLLTWWKLNRHLYRSGLRIVKKYIDFLSMYVVWNRSSYRLCERYDQESDRLLNKEYASEALSKFRIRVWTEFSHITFRMDLLRKKDGDWSYPREVDRLQSVLEWVETGSACNHPNLL